MAQLETTYCDHCGDELEIGQVGLCEDCQEQGKVAETHGTLCPQCGDDSQLEVVAQIWVRLVEDGTDDSDDGDQTYDDDSPARCLGCDWHGPFGAMRSAYALEHDPVLVAILAYAKSRWCWDDYVMIQELYDEHYGEADTPEQFVDRYAEKFNLTGPKGV